MRWFVLAVALALGSSAAADPLLKNAAKGTPKMASAQVIAFAPGGTLLIGDGAGGQVIAVDTGDVTLQKWMAGPIADIDVKLAEKLGVTVKNIELSHMAVNPASGKAYFAVKKLDDKSSVILTVDGTGKIGECTLENVPFVTVALPRGAKDSALRITDLTYGADRILVGGMATEEFACKVVSIPTPIDGSAGKATGFSTETYHVAHRKWETKAPMTSLMLFEEDGKKYVVGAFACTPVVRYPLDDIKADAVVKGESVIELGNGNRPLNMFAYVKDGKPFMLMNTFRFQHEKNPYGPSPYWTAKIDMSLLSEKEKINEKALLRLDKNKPATDRVTMVEAYHGVAMLDKLDAERALVVKEGKAKEKTLEALLLP